MQNSSIAEHLHHGVPCGTPHKNQSFCLFWKRNNTNSGKYGNALHYEIGQMQIKRQIQRWENSVHKINYFCALGNVSCLLTSRQNTLIHLTERSRVWKPLYSNNWEPSYAEMFVTPHGMYSNQIFISDQETSNNEWNTCCAWAAYMLVGELALVLGFLRATNLRWIVEVL